MAAGTEAGAGRLKRIDAARIALKHAGDDALVVVCNGMIGREVWTIGDRPTHFYMIGSMGLAASIALGLALAQPNKRVVCLDGDGNVLMGMGVLASVAVAAPKNFFHVVLDNEAHGSTGDQRTITEKIQLEEIARASGYRWARRADDEATLDAMSTELFAQSGPVMLLAKVAKGNVPGIGRVALTPPELAHRMRQTSTR
jgi:thiamine pyrophosphate-dependent acetolactate synthase large subunit-like protein